MSTIGIYKITNKTNNQSYIGQSVNIEKRWKKHKCEYLKENQVSYNYPLYRAFRKYGLDNFLFEVIEECKKDELNKKEIYWIKYHNTFFNGYNQTLGGDHGTSVPKENILGIFEDLENTQLTHGEIAKRRNVSIEMVDGINTGRHWHQDREYPIQTYIPKKRQKIKKDNKKTIIYQVSKPNNCIVCNKAIPKKNTYCLECYKKEHSKNVPSKEQLIEELLVYPMVQIGKRHNVTDKAVVKWCKKYELPYKRKDIIEFRNNYNKKGDY